MKRNQLSFAACLFAIAIWSCNSGNNTTGSSTDSTGTSSTTTSTSGTSGTGTSDSTGTASSTSSTPTTPTTTNSAASMPLGKEDSTFVMKAAVGGMEEVELGNIAQQNASSQRVKDFGAMMVRDHSKANDELKSLASSKGMTIPTTLPAEKQKDVDNMKKMTGKSFDQHYVSMMVNDHKKDVGEFKKASGSAKDADLKNWAGKTLPVLQTHLDSIQSIQKAKM